MRSFLASAIGISGFISFLLSYVMMLGAAFEVGPEIGVLFFFLGLGGPITALGVGFVWGFWAPMLAILLGFALMVIAGLVSED